MIPWIRRRIAKLEQVSFAFVMGVSLSVVTRLGALVLSLLAAAKILKWDIETTADQFVASLAAHWLLVTFVIIATILVQFRPGDWIQKRQRQRRQAEYQSTYLEAGLEALRLQIGQRKPNWQRAREQLLFAAAQMVSTAIGGTDKDSVKANLVLLAPDGKITVPSRSKPGSPIGTVYKPEPHWPVSLSIERNETVAYDLQKGEGVRDGEKRPYRAIVATPIVTGSKALGAISLDSPHQGHFKRQEAKIDRILRPFAQVMLITISKDSCSKPCPVRYHS